MTFWREHTVWSVCFGGKQSDWLIHLLEAQAFHILTHIVEIAFCGVVDTFHKINANKKTKEIEKIHL